MKSNSTIVLKGQLNKQLVFKKYRYGNVVTKYPDMSKAGCSAEQRSQRTRFQQAVAWAKETLADPEKKKYYQKLRGKGSAWNKALKDFLKNNINDPLR
jgi:nitrate reductase alpha subunit